LSFKLTVYGVIWKVLAWVWIGWFAFFRGSHGYCLQTSKLSKTQISR